MAAHFLYFILITLVTTIISNVYIKHKSSKETTQIKPEVKNNINPEFRKWWWLYHDGINNSFDKNGRIKFEILWEYGIAIQWGIGGASDRNNLSSIISDNLYEDERAVIIAATISNLSGEYRQRILKWIQDSIQKKDRGEFKKENGEYWYF